MKHVLAFDIGGTNTRLSLINEKYEVVKQLILPTKTGDVETFINNVFDVVDGLNINMDEVVSAGAGVPGVVDRENNYIIDLPNVHVKDIPLGEVFEKRYGVKLFIRNDAEVACLAEANLGAGKEFNRTFFITVSTGLGGALCVDGINQDYITEVGHTAVVYKGVLSEYERLCSGSGIPNLCKLNNVEVKDSKEFFDRVRANDEIIMPIYEDWLTLFSQWIRLMKDSYEPEVFCFTGGVFKNKDIFFEELKRRNPDCNMVECIYKEDAGTIGAAVYAFQNAK